MLRALSATRPRRTQRWADPFRELAIGLATFACYVLVNGLDLPGRQSVATHHAGQLFGLEHRLHLAVEPPLNRWLAAHHPVAVAANYEYATTYVISAFGLLFWLYRRRPELYRWARRSFVLLNLTAMVCFLAWPLTPPRLLPQYGFVDTVRSGHTWGSWGSPVVAHADTLAAMPSLHLGWALWVSAVLAAVAGGARIQWLSAVHVGLTTWVVVATGNHFVLDAVVAAVFVAGSLHLAGPRPPAAGRPVAAPDALFVHLDAGGVPQLVGAALVLATGSAGPLTREEALRELRGRLRDLPVLRRCLDVGGHGRRPRWRPVDRLAVAEHLECVELDDRTDPEAAFAALVAATAARPLPADRPPWRAVVVPNLGPGRAGLIVLIHHSLADGLGTVAVIRGLLDPLPAPAVPALRSPPAPVRAAVTALGLLHLARDGRARDRLPVEEAAPAAFQDCALPVGPVRAAARQRGVRLTDLLLTALGEALHRHLRAGRPAHVRVAVTRMLPGRDRGACGNFTGSVQVEIPLGAMSLERRLALVAARCESRLRHADRAVAGRFALRVVGAMSPGPAFRAFARHVYGPPFFSAILSNLPGPTEPVSFAGRPVITASPVLPLAPGLPVALGAVSCGGQLCLGLTVRLPSVEPAALAEALTDALRRLTLEPSEAGAGHGHPPDDHAMATK